MNTTLSLNKPRTARAPQPALKAKAHPFDQFAGQHIAAQCGPVIYEGMLTVTSNWLIFRDATVIGTRHRMELGEVYLNRNLQVQHVHLVSSIKQLDPLDLIQKAGGTV